MRLTLHSGEWWEKGFLKTQTAGDGNLRAQRGKNGI